MEELIKQTVIRVKSAFVCFWVLPILIVLAGEMEMEWVGRFADNFSITYLAETVSILLSAICIPVALKLFSKVLNKKIDHETLPVALKLYVQWSYLRLLLLALPVLVGFLTYYVTLSNTGVLCALIALTASLFCIPGEARMRKELHIDKEQSE